MGTLQDVGVQPQDAAHGREQRCRVDAELGQPVGQGHHLGGQEAKQQMAQLVPDAIGARRTLREGAPPGVLVLERARKARWVSKLGAGEARLQRVGVLLLSHLDREPMQSGGGVGVGSAVDHDMDRSGRRIDIHG